MTCGWRLAVVVGLLAGTLLVGCQAGSNPSTPSMPAAPAVTVVTITVTGPTPVAGGPAVQLSATARLSDSSTIDITAQATWAAANTGIASVSSTGALTAHAPGVTDVRATYQGVSGAMPLDIYGPVVHNTLNAAGSNANLAGVNSYIVTGLPGEQRVMDDFISPATTTIRRIDWQGLYCPSAGLPSSPSAAEVAVFFYSDRNTSGTPFMSLLTSARVPVASTRQTLDRRVDGACASYLPAAEFYNYELHLPAPLPVVAGARYWVMIQPVIPATVTDDGKELRYIWRFRYGTPDNNYSIVNPGEMVIHPRDFAFALR